MKLTLTWTSLFMISAHGYAWANGMLLFDTAFLFRKRISFFNTPSDKWLTPLMDYLDLGYNLPWLAGILATFAMVIVVYCLVEILNIKKWWAIALVAGICSTNSCIISQHQYTGGFFVGPIALMFSTLALLISYKSNFGFKKKLVLASICIACSSGIYGAYVSIVPVIMIYMIARGILNGKTARECWRNLLLSVICFGGGMVLYYVILRLLIYTGNQNIQSYMGEDNLKSVTGIFSMASSVPKAYIELCRYYLGLTDYLPRRLINIQQLIIVSGIIIGIAIIVERWKSIKDKLSNVILLLLLAIALPGCINLIYILSSGNVHYLMIFSYCIPLLICIKEVEYFVVLFKSEKVKVGCYSIVVLFIGMIYFSVVMANAIYVHYGVMLSEATSICDRLLERIEETDGFSGNEEIILYGSFINNDYFRANEATDSELLGAFIGPSNKTNVNAICWASLLRRYMKNIYNCSLDIYLWGEIESDNDVSFIEEMSLFPADGSIKRINNKIYVRLGEE